MPFGLPFSLGGGQTMTCKMFSLACGNIPILLIIWPFTNQFLVSLAQCKRCFVVMKEYTEKILILSEIQMLGSSCTYIYFCHLLPLQWSLSKSREPTPDSVS
jgi:hypothetical protein